ncbi:ammonium transporter family protein [Brevundimonas sp.]|uniref:ammonium transporter family protein n=1 Tax=Brevundimonas sp. TaxID=1871086 RepID=UPI003F6EF603
MKVSTLLAAAGAILTLSAGAALAAEGCECCKDMAADAAMSCCDKMKPEPAPAPTPTPAPGAEEPAPSAPGHSHHQ